MCAFNVARPRPTTCNLHACRQASELHLDSFFISTTLLSFEQLIHLDYFICRRVGWWRDGFLAARWFLGGELVGGETPWWWDDWIPWQGIKTIKHIHMHIRYTFTSPLPENRKDENWKMWKLKDVKILAAEISLINSVPVRMTLPKTCPSSDVWNCKNAKT